MKTSVPECELATPLLRTRLREIRSPRQNCSEVQRVKQRSCMYRRILLAFDGSPDGREALAQAQGVAAACGSTVHLVAIIDLSESLLVVEAMSSIPDNQAFVIQAVLDEAVRRLEGTGCTATSELKYGKPAEQIILAAAEIEADLIIVGHRDQGMLARWLNGSVGESILHQPPCSVLVAVKSGRCASNVTSAKRLAEPRSRSG